jgi:hypothetical protein
MTEFLTCRGGALIAANYIVSISPLVVRATGCHHEIEYCVGAEARSTTASEDSVIEFLEEVQ